VKGLTVPDGSRWLVRDLDFEVKPGTVHMVLGERDTGKTALLETLAGLRREERGTVRLGDDDASLRDRRRGTRFLPRDLDATQLSIRERLLVARPPRRFGIAIHGRKAEEYARALAKRVGLEALLDVPVEALRPLERRLLELAAAFSESPRAVFLDEPTSELGPHEARHLLAMTHAIARDDGVPVVFTSTWARDGYPDADAVTILWQGQAPVTVSTAEVTESALVDRWTGGGLRRAPTGPHSAAGDALLRIENIVLEGRGRETSLAGVAFEVRSGEVLAIVGAPADGLDLLHDVLLGHRKPDRGSIQFLGKELVATDRRQRVEAGVSFVSPPHARDQSLGNFSVEENLILGQTRHGPFARRGWLKFESIRGNAVRSLSDFEVPDAKPRDRFARLSLGARQRIVIAREVLRDPVLLVARSPAQGLSLESQEYLRKALVLQCERRSGLLWLSEDPDEALRVADRLAVLAAGRLVWLPVTETLTREAIIDEMSGTAA